MTIQSELVPQNLWRPLDRIAQDLHDKYEGVFGSETIESLVEDSYIKLAARATVTQWLVVSTQRLAGERLDALVHAEDHSMNKVPTVLFSCTHNAGRSTGSPSRQWPKWGSISPGATPSRGPKRCCALPTSSSRWDVGTRVRSCRASTTKTGTLQIQLVNHSRSCVTSETIWGTGCVICRSGCMSSGHRTIWRFGSPVVRTCFPPQGHRERVPHHTKRLPQWRPRTQDAVGGSRTG